MPGYPLGRDERVSDTFFDELAELVSWLHERHMAYVDLNKRQNILMGDDGRPYLIDFQISLHLPPTGWRRWRGLMHCRWRRGSPARGEGERRQARRVPNSVSEKSSPRA